MGNYDSGCSIATNVADGCTMVAVGDLMVSRALTKGHNPGFDAAVLQQVGGEEMPQRTHCDVL